MKKRVFSGIQPTGNLHIGNYLGAVRQFIELAKSHECFLMVADLHALTTVQNREQLSHNIETLILHELSLLGDLSRITFFRQSDIPEHTELQTILNNVTPMGLLKRAHAYKDKLSKDTELEDINIDDKAIVVVKIKKNDQEKETKKASSEQDKDNPQPSKPVIYQLLAMYVTPSLQNPLSEDNLVNQAPAGEATKSATPE